MLDLIGSFFVFGYAIALVTGNTSEGGFSLDGGWAVLLVAVVVAYFVLMKRFFGATLGQRALRVRGAIADRPVA